MMFLVIFSSLAAAMAIVSQGNLSTADAHLKVNRALAAAETGLYFVQYHLGEVTRTVRTREGVITAQLVREDLWPRVQAKLVDELSGDESAYLDGKRVHIGPVAVGPNAPEFTAVLSPHPLVGENYDGDYYQRPPYSTMTPAVSNANALDERWVRVTVTAADGDIERSISIDFRVDKRIPYALLSKSRVMIGRNVILEGPVGSTFEETHLEHGHPIQMVSDFRGLDSELDTDLDALVGSLVESDYDGDNRLRVGSAETEDLADPAALDTNQDGYIDEYDFFLSHFDSDGNNEVSQTELDTYNNVHARQLLELIDRAGNNNGVIDPGDNYTKIRGEIYVSADLQGWEDGSANGAYQDYFQGPIDPRYQRSPLSFEAEQNNTYQFEPSDFDVSSFASRATGDLYSQASQQAANHDPNDPNSPQPLGQQVTESVPYQAAYPYDWYDRPVFENMTFTDVKIPKGTNAVFRNCRFIGVTFVETTANNTDENFNYAGAQEEDGTSKHPDRDAVVDGEEVDNTKTAANNIRFDGCTFEGGVVTDTPAAYTHARNKLSFTGATRFEIENSTHLSPTEKSLYKRSTILAPHYSVELGTFVSPNDSTEAIQLSGTIVAGLIDMRGRINVNGTILTTFEPKSNEGPVLGETSPQFNTTIGYFGSEQGDYEAEMPETGVGAIHVTYDPTLPLPDGVLGPIQIEPVESTYFEHGAY